MTTSETITNLGNAIIGLTNRKVNAHSAAVEGDLLDLKDRIDEIIEQLKIFIV